MAFLHSPSGQTTNGQVIDLESLTDLTDLTLLIDLTHLISSLLITIQCCELSVSFTGTVWLYKCRRRVDQMTPFPGEKRGA